MRPRELLKSRRWSLDKCHGDLAGSCQDRRLCGLPHLCWIDMDSNPLLIDPSCAHADELLLVEPAQQFLNVNFKVSIRIG